MGHGAGAGRDHEAPRRRIDAERARQSERELGVDVNSTLQRWVDHRRAGQARSGRANPAPRPAAVGLLQRHAGNRAVTRWLGSRNATVQRFVGHEHESLGNVTGATIDLGHGVVLTWGQVVAIAGDEFKDVEDLETAASTEPGRRRIRAALEHDGVRGPIPASLPTPTPEERSEQGTTFIMLALENVAHFAEGGDARASWRSHHGRALQAALNSGLTGDAAAFQQAQLLEAFGQHFLTDMFSGGHVRVPRQEIMDFYADKAGAMTTAFVDNLRKRVEDALVSQVMLQISPMLRGNYTQGKAREKVHAAVGVKVDEGLAKIGGMSGLTRYFGLALAGAVSGALHDREGREGVVVNSEDHPQPWLAKGDAKLDQSPEGRDQAERAVLAGREELLAARHAGEREVKLDKLVPADPPAVIHFGFDSATLAGPGADGAAAAGAYLHANPTSHVELVGHTDPLGTGGYNKSLGQRRADAVKSALIAGGASADQIISATSQGEDSLATSDPKQYSQNRRVQLHWQSRPVPPGGPADPQSSPDRSTDKVRERAEQALLAFGPPYAAVERYIPQAMPHMNEPLPEWRWGQMAPELVADLDTWIKDLVGPHTQKVVEAVPETIQEGDYTLAPRQIVQGIITELMQAPSRTLGNLIGQPPGGDS